MENSSEPASRNVEVKAHVRNLEKVKETANQLSGDGRLLHQSDQFYAAPKGHRLKLRREQEKCPQLVWYSRPDEDGPKLSNYRLCSLNDDEQADSLDRLLGDCLGRTGSLKKTRNLYMVGQTRVHVDSVEGLGDFMELEVVLEPDQTLEMGQQIANDLLEKLGIPQEDLISGSYMDMFHKLQISK